MDDLNRGGAAMQGAEGAPLAGGFVAGTPILTLDGELPVQFLAPGDRVVTRSGTRTIAEVEVRVVYGATLVRLSPAALGQGRPGEDLFVAPGQRLQLPVWPAGATAGATGGATAGASASPGVVAAERLADGQSIRTETVAEVRLYALRFASEEVVYAAGLELTCPPSRAA